MKEETFHQSLERIVNTPREKTIEDLYRLCNFQQEKTNTNPKLVLVKTNERSK